MNREQELLDIIGDANSELDAIRDARRIAENATLVGKCFKYRNCYSCPGPDDYWWLYIKITGMDERGHLSGWGFQTDKDGKIQIEPRVVTGGSRLLEGYKEIHADEFKIQYVKLIEEVSEFNDD